MCALIAAKSYDLNDSEARLRTVSIPVEPINRGVAAFCRTFRAPAYRIQTSSAITESQFTSAT